MTITRLGVCSAIDKAESEFMRCWQVLSQVKTGKPSFASAEEILGFQGVLARALFDLEQLHVSISHEESQVIQHKARLTPSWFRRRLKLLSEYRTAISAAIALGRTLGDAFAWIFYQHNRVYLTTIFAL